MVENVYLVSQSSRVGRDDYVDDSTKFVCLLHVFEKKICLRY